MPDSDFVILAIFPLTLWIGIAYVAHSNSGFALALRASWRAKTKQELTEGARSWALYALLMFSIPLVAVLAWARVERPDLIPTVLSSNHWGSDVFRGTYLGLTVLGLLLIFKSQFPEARNFTLLVMAGAESSVLTRICILVTVIFAEELWRAVCLRVLIGDGFYGPNALILVSAAYGLAYLVWRVPVAISETVVGTVCGALFLWSNSFIVPFAVRVVIQAQVLLYATFASNEAKPGDINRRPFTTCPACGKRLNSAQVNLNFNEAFFCPFCHTRVTVSDSRRGFLRWGFVFVSTALMVGSWEILPGAAKGSEAQVWLSLAITACSAIGLWSIVQAIFPPKLECGDPDLVALNLGDKHGKPDSEKERNGS